MPIKNSNLNMGVFKGAVPLKSVMIGTQCVYGFDSALFKISYPSVTNGTGLYIEVNGERKISNAAAIGELEVHYGDSVLVKTYAEAGYENPVSSVNENGNSINGTDYTINIGEISIIRSTTYQFSVAGNSNIMLTQATPAPEISIGIAKDQGIDNISLYYIKGPYEYSGLNNPTLETKESLFTFAEETVQMFKYSNISPKELISVANEGYKVVSTTKNFSGLLTSNNQCSVTAISQAGTRVSVVCPPIPNGITEYALTMVSSEYSRTLNNNAQFYNQNLENPSQTSVQLSQRDKNQYYFYKGDTIKISAKRKDGFKLPSLGKQGETVTPLITNKQIVLTHENVLVVESGEKGIPVQLINNALSTNEYVLLQVTSEFMDYIPQQRNPQIYVGDRIEIPLSTYYRKGTRSYRKPGVGFNADGNVILEPTFNSDAILQVPHVSVLTIVLQQGAARISTDQFSLSYVAKFSRISNISPMEISYRSIRDDSFIPVSGYGPEEYFLYTFDMTYSCKRYWLDAITSKYNKIRQYNVPRNFSYEYDCDIWPTKVVIAGSYEIDADGKAVTLEVSEYDTDWVANSSDQAKLIPNKIII